MRVFSAYIKVAKEYKISIFVYFLIFIALEFLVVKAMLPEDISTFEMTRFEIWVVNEDEDTELTDGLLTWLKQHGNVTEADWDEERIADALYFRTAEYVIRIPEGFTRDFLAGQNVKLGKLYIEGAYSDVYMDQVVDQYLDTLHTYREALPEESFTKILYYTVNDLLKETAVRMLEDRSDIADRELLAQSFGMASYVILGSLTMGICMVMGTFYKKEIRSRNLCSPMREREWNRSLILGNAALGGFMWVLLMIVEFILCGDILFTPAGLWMGLNLLVFTICGIAIAMLISYAVRGSSAQMSVSNVLAMGLTFLSGVFVPQSMLGEQVNTVASFNPVYWYVNCNNLLGDATELTAAVLKEVAKGFFIQIAFAAAIFAVALLIAKQKKFIKVYE